MRYSILGALLFFVGWACAGNVTEQQARRVAVAFFQSAPQTRVSESDLRLVRDSESTLTRSGGAAPAYYVFDNAAGGGFVIVSGDDVASPVLGYSFTEEFPEGNLPSNVQGWLDGLREEINAARRDGVEAEEAVTQPALSPSPRPAHLYRMHGHGPGHHHALPPMAGEGRGHASRL